ncbi:TonB-dependent receptor plug domain-containing protein [Pseudoxanthomonas suwonensis]
MLASRKGSIHFAPVQESGASRVGKSSTKNSKGPRDEAHTRAQSPEQGAVCRHDHAAGRLCLRPGSPQASDQTESTPSAGATSLDRVTVTGSRIKRVEIEGPAPVTVITADDIEKQGFSTVYDALNTLTEFTGSVQNELNQNGFTPNASFLNLRGLGPGYQLVLVNGRRTADYPLPYNSQSNAVNLANIPTSAVERIEVLSGGASAIYGSDAVAGVVNVILKTNYEGDLLTARAGTTTRGGGDSGRLQWIGGKVGQRWSLTYAAEYLAREEIFASQRDFMDSYRDDPSVDPEDAVATIGIRMRDRLVGTGLASYIYPQGKPRPPPAPASASSSSRRAAPAATSAIRPPSRSATPTRTSPPTCTAPTTSTTACRASPS